MEIELPQFPPPRRTSSLAIFLNSLTAFILREFKNRFGLTRLGYLWALFDPAASCAVFVLLHAILRGHAESIYGQNPMLFFVLGIVPFFMFNDVTVAQTGAIEASKGLFNYRQIRPIDILLAKSIIEFGLLALVLALFFAACWLLDLPIEVENAALLLLALLSLFALGFAAGLCFEVYGTLFKELRRAFALGRRGMFFLSGTFYTIEMVPEPYRPYLLWNPVLHLIEIVRDATYVGYRSPGGDWYYVIGSLLVLLFLGLAGYRRYQHLLI